MSTAFTKSKLKASRDAIGKKDYALARQNAEQVLDYEPENYNARVFLALALLELGNVEESESEYHKAIEASPTQLLAWQGIAKLYEKTEKWDKYAQTLLGLGDLFKKSGDATKCAENIQKYIDLRRERGTRKEITEALRLLLPESPYFSLLGALPEPDPTNPSATTTFAIQSALHNSLPIYQELVDLAEREESEFIKKEVDKRRMRLNAAGPEQLKMDVGKEVWGVSSLPELYQEVISHPSTSDELRRETEAKLLRYKQSYLYALSSTGPEAAIKAKLGEEVDEIIKGVVLLRIPDELAWLMHIDSIDADTIEQYDFGTLAYFIELFPSAPISVMIRAYFTYIGYNPDADDDDEEPPKKVEDSEDLVNTILETYSSTSKLVLSNRIVASLYLADIDYENAIKVSENGLEVLRQVETRRGKKLDLCRKAFNVVLATSLVHYFPPKHHPHALGIIADVLSLQPDNIACLLARAYVYQAASDWAQAASVFDRVMELATPDTDDGLRAMEEYNWCQVQLLSFDVGLEGLQATLQRLQLRNGQDDEKARCLWRIGKCYWEMGNDQKEEAYRHFISCLKSDSTYAPAFTSLGVYYAEVASPPDLSRASKCFQKAFELDARESEAARRLADGFAEEREWDLVEVIARRTIEGEGGLEGGLKSEKAVPGRYTPTNAWAWKAIGVVELIQKNYPAAIQAFQVALRANLEDDVSWLRLGEAYSKAGRHVAAIKALKRAQELQPDQWLCNYFLGEVQRQVGQYEEAINSFRAILAQHPAELGVLMALSQTYIDLGRFESSESFVARAEESFTKSIQYALTAIREHTGFRGVAWKAIGDALFYMSHSSSFYDPESVDDLFGQVHSLISSNVSEDLKSIAHLFSLLSQSETSIKAVSVLELAILAYDHRISLGFTDSSIGASAWYDLGTSLHTWSERVKSMEDNVSQQAISFVKKAIREDPGNDMFWNTFGNMNFTRNPKLAQHAFIKAAEINNKNVITWTNLGLLYFRHDDLELANEAFYRAQTLDPDYTPAWIGQVLVATAHGHTSDTKNLIEHAITLSRVVPEADLEFASRTFKSLKDASIDDEATLSSLLTCFFVLNRYLLHRSNHADGLHLLGLVCERMDILDVSEKVFTRAISTLEAIYEDTEDATIESQFTIANANLARVKLALNDYEGALESFEAAIGLLEDGGPELLKARAQMGAGMAQFKLGHLEEAIEQFENALENSADDSAFRGQVTVLLSQTLWAIGTEEFKESAKGQLLDCITTDPENLAAITALASMGIASGDESLVDASLTEILSLPIEKRRALDPGRDVDYLLVQHYLALGEANKALTIGQTAVHAEPFKEQPRIRLATIALQMSYPERAKGVLSAVGGNGHLMLKAVAEVLGGDEKEALQLAQRAVFLRPENIKNWEALAIVRSKVSRRHE